MDNSFFRARATLDAENSETLARWPVQIFPKEAANKFRPGHDRLLLFNVLAEARTLVVNLVRFSD